MSYFLDPHYVIRKDNAAFDDTPFKAEFQAEVYSIARRVAEEHQLKSIVDIGCGSGFKLMEYFPRFDTLGIEIDPCLSFLRETYPDRRWMDADFLSAYLAQYPNPNIDLVICSDVIEHLPDPDKLLDTIASCKPKVIVISTPALEHLEGGCMDGPPRNIHHAYEWRTDQFRAYIGSRFDVLDQVVTLQKNQVVVCRPFQ